MDVWNLVAQVLEEEEEENEDRRGVVAPVCSAAIYGVQLKRDDESWTGEFRKSLWWEFEEFWRGRGV